MTKGPIVKKTFLNYLIIIATFFSMLSISYAVEVNHHPRKDCDLMRDQDAKVNCWKLEKIDRKLTKVLRLLKHDNGGPDFYYPLQTEYTCKIKSSSYSFEGHGKSIDEATKDAFKMCKFAHYSQNTCARMFQGCESLEFDANDHFQCEVKGIKSLGETKREAKDRAMQLCKMAYHSDALCVRGFKQCVFKPGNNHH